MPSQHPIRGGYVPHDLYKLLMDAVQSIPGVYMELGVWRGDTFKFIYDMANEHGKPSIGVDSFCGLPEPSTPGEENMPKGKFDVGGSADFRQRFPKAICIEGWIPEVLDEYMRVVFTQGIEDPKKFIAFAHIDVDHCKTTRECCEWVWDHLAPNGIMVGHDFSFDAHYGAMLGYQQWMDATGVDYLCIEHTSIVFRKTDAHTM